MREEFAKSGGFYIIYYSTVVLLNDRLAKDLELPNVSKNAMKIIEYFSDTHLPNAWYKASGGKLLVTPHKMEHKV